MREALTNRPTTVADYLAILRRRLAIVILPPLIAGLAAFFLSARQDPVYRASADVLVNRTSVVGAITQVSDPAAGDPTRFLTTQASIARSPELATRVVRAAGVPGLTPGGLLGESSVDPSPDSDLLHVSVSDRSGSVATLLANTYAQEFTRYKTELDTARIDKALEALNTRIKALQDRGATSSPAYETLVEDQGKLETVGKLLADNTSVLRPADGAGKVHPRPRRNAILGGLLGAVLGLALAFLGEALDRRVRTEKEIEDALELPLLARVPKPPRQLRKADELVMLKEPTSVHAETFRKLKTSIEFVNPHGAARTIMVTSAVEQEGKSTTIANLAVALARGNRRVALVDLDLRRPFLGRLFHVNGRPGITDVAMSRASLTDVIRPIALPAMTASDVDSRMNGRKSASPPSNGRTNVESLLHFVPAGTIPPSAGELLDDDRLLAVLDELATRFDVVLVDTPPLLAFDDAMILSAKVDAIFAITRLGKVQRPILHEFARQLRNCQADVLGYVITGVDHGDSYAYMYNAYSYNVSQKTSTKERA
jgi:polysaccharide biosynthesis transport protein